MDLERLKELLKNGTISQEEFHVLLKACTEEEESTGKQEEKEKKEESEKNYTAAELKDFIQREIDRATNRLGNDNKKLKEELEKERKKNLSVEELKQLEIAEKEKELEEREKAFQLEKNRMYAVKAMKKIGLDDGTEEALGLVEFVLTEDETEIDTRVKTLSKLIDARVKAEVDKIFKENGREPERSNIGNEQENPYEKETFNLTKQMELELSNPELAKTMKKNAKK